MQNSLFNFKLPNIRKIIFVLFFCTLSLNPFPDAFGTAKVTHQHAPFQILFLNFIPPLFIAFEYQILTQFNLQHSDASSLNVYNLILPKGSCY
jgi:hypothetical protein